MFLAAPAAVHWVSDPLRLRELRRLRSFCKHGAWHVIQYCSVFGDESAMNLTSSHQDTVLSPTLRGQRSTSQVSLYLVNTSGNKHTIYQSSLQTRRLCFHRSPTGVYGLVFAHPATMTEGIITAMWTELGYFMWSLLGYKLCSYLPKGYLEESYFWCLSVFGRTGKVGKEVLFWQWSKKWFTEDSDRSLARYASEASAPPPSLYNHRLQFTTDAVDSGFVRDTVLFSAILKLEHSCSSQLRNPPCARLSML
jgi:hypothetical protein